MKRRKNKVKNYNLMKKREVRKKWKIKGKWKGRRCLRKGRRCLRITLPLFFSFNTCSVVKWTDHALCSSLFLFFFYFPSFYFLFAIIFSLFSLLLPTKRLHYELMALLAWKIKLSWLTPFFFPFLPSLPFFFLSRSSRERWPIESLHMGILFILFFLSNIS